jgi:hypothetical protein
MIPSRAVAVTLGVLLSAAVLAGCGSGSPQAPADASLLDGGAASDAPGADAGPDGLVPAAIPLAACGPMYTATVTLGGSQSFVMITDTGSSTTAVAAAGCTACASDGITPLYQPGPSAVDRQRTASSSYLSTPPTNWSGEVYGDTVGLTGAPVAPTVDLAAITAESNFFAMLPCSTQPFQGILGLGPSDLLVAGTNSYLDRVVAEAGTPDVFATRLCPSAGTLWIGGYDPAVLTAPVQFTPMNPSGSGSHYYSLTVAEVQVGGASLGLPSSAYGPGFVDSGSTAFFLTSQVFSAVTAALNGSTPFRDVFGDAAAFFDMNSYGCVSVAHSQAELDSQLPTLTVTLGTDAPIAVESAATESYLMAIDDGAGGVLYCPGILEAPAGFDLFDLGAPILRGKVTVYDRELQRIGFGPAPCS